MSKDTKNNKNPKESQNSRGVLEIIRAIKSGELAPNQLSTQDRQACVMHLGLEGLSVPEIAQVLKVSDRTIARDRKAIQEANALEHDPKLAGLFAGRLASEAESCINRIRRVTRDRDTPPAVKVEGERLCYEIVDKLTQRLQSLGYLPTAAQQIQADLTHHLGEPMSPQQMIAEIQRLEQIQNRKRIDAEVKATGQASDQSSIKHTQQK